MIHSLWLSQKVGYTHLVRWPLQGQRITMVACGDTFTVAVSEGRLHTLLLVQEVDYTHTGWFTS